MADSDKVKISELVSDVSLSGDENIPLLDTDGIVKKTTVGRIGDFAQKRLCEVDVHGTGEVDYSFFIKRLDQQYPLRADFMTTVNDALNYAFGMETVEDYTEAEIIIKTPDGVRVTDIDQMAEIVKGKIELDAMDIHGLPAGGVITSDDEIAIAQGDDKEPARVSASMIVDYVVQSIPSSVDTSTALLDDDDKILAVDKTNGALKKVAVSDSGLGTGDVNGPSSNTDGKIPLWDGNNSKKLKDGLTLTDSITSTSSSTEVPSAAAVYGAITDGAMGDAANAAIRADVASSTGAIPTFVDEKIDGEVLATGKIGRAIASGVESKLANESVVRKFGLTTEGKIPVFATETGEVKITDGYEVDRAISEYPSHGKLPTTAAVSTYVQNKIDEERLTKKFDGTYVGGGRIAVFETLGGRELAETDVRISGTADPISSPSDSIVLTERASFGAARLLAKDEIGSAIGLGGAIRSKIDERISAEVLPPSGSISIAAHSVASGEIDAAVASGGTVDLAISSKISAESMPRGVIGTAASAISESVCRSLVPTLATPIAEEKAEGAAAAAITEGVASGGAISIAISGAITSEMTASGRIGSALVDVVKDEGERTNAPAAMIGVRYTTDPNTGDLVPHYGRYQIGGGNSVTANVASPEGYVAVWSGSNPTQNTRNLSGKELVTSVGSQSLDIQIPTAKAVMSAIEAAKNGLVVNGAASQSKGNHSRWVPLWNEGTTTGYTGVTQGRPLYERGSGAYADHLSEVPNVDAVVYIIEQYLAAHPQN